MRGNAVVAIVAAVVFVGGLAAMLSEGKWNDFAGGVIVMSRLVVFSVAPERHRKRFSFKPVRLMKSGRVST